jgi:hypothetical protein
MAPDVVLPWGVVKASYYSKVRKLELGGSGRDCSSNFCMKTAVLEWNAEEVELLFYTNFIETRTTGSSLNGD